MKQKHWINQMLIMIVLIIFAVYVLACNMSAASYPAAEKMYAFIFRTGCRFSVANLSYEKVSGEDSVEKWIANNVLNLIPLGNYMESKWSLDTDVEDSETIQMILAKQAADENEVDEEGNLVNGEEKVSGDFSADVDISMEALKDYEYLISHFYTVDTSTMADSELLDADKLLGKSMKIDEKEKGPKILIYHTHSQEAFVDSRAGDKETTIVGVGAYLAELMNEKYGIETIHHQGVYDLIDGKLDRSKAYQLAEPEIQEILKKNPEIEVVIDLHRDGVGENTHLVTEIDGKPTAQIMFFNGLSRSRTNGDIAYLENPYIQDNLAFSFQMQLAAARIAPGFTRHIYLKAYRYNMHLAPKTLLVEAGAQTNTVEEMRNAMEVLSEILDYVLTE